MSKDIHQAYTQVALKDLWPHSRWTVIASPLFSHVLLSSQWPDLKYHKLLHPSSLAAPLFSPFLKVNMSALCTSCCRSQCRDVSTALYQHLFQSSSSYPDTKTPSPPSPSVVLHTSVSFAGTSLSVFRCRLSNRFQCKAAWNHINPFSQPLNVFHHLLCQLVIFHSIPCD